MKMKHVELVSAFAHVVEHREMRRDLGFQPIRVEPERAVAGGHQARTGPSVAAREQRSVVAEGDEGIA